MTQKAKQYKEILKQNPRMYRTVQKMICENEDAASSAICFVLAPSLGAFIQWLLLKALSDGKRRLYFLARDGYFMYRAALIFCQTLDLPIECRYLSCSRYSLRIPTFHLDQNAALDYVCRDGIDVTFEKILARAGLTSQEQETIFSYFPDFIQKNETIPRNMLSTVRRRLRACPLFLEYMNTHSKQALPQLAGYLKQEGLLEEIPDGIVDSGWIGSMQKTLNEVLSYLGRTQKLEGYYWGLYDLPCGVSENDYHCYYFRPSADLRKKVFFNNCLFETIYTAPHGMTLCYKKDGNIYNPWYGPITKQRKKFIEKTELYLMQYIRILAQDCRKKGFQSDLLSDDRRVLSQLLCMFMTTPSKSEAEIFGRLLFSDDVFANESTPLAPLMTEQELHASHIVPKLFHTQYPRKKFLKQSAWYEGSVVRSSKQIRSHLRQYTFYKYIRYLRQIYDFKKNRR